MLRALSLVCLAHAATGWSIAPTAGQALVARPRFVVRVAPSVMMTPTTELVAELAAAPGAIPSALVAYGHYLSFMVGTACVTAERLTIKPAMTMEEEKVMTVADTTYGLTALLLVYTGYLRVTQYGKGWEFYQHECVLHHEHQTLALALAQARSMPRLRVSCGASQACECACAHARACACMCMLHVRPRAQPQPDRQADLLGEDDAAGRRGGSLLLPDDHHHPARHRAAEARRHAHRTHVGEAGRSTRP